MRGREMRAQLPTAKDLVILRVGYFSWVTGGCLNRYLRPVTSLAPGCSMTRCRCLLQRHRVVLLPGAINVWANRNRLMVLTGVFDI